MPATSTDIPPDAVKLAKALVDELAQTDSQFYSNFKYAVARVLFHPRYKDALVQLILSVWPSEGQSS